MLPAAKGLEGAPKPAAAVVLETMQARQELVQRRSDHRAQYDGRDQAECTPRVEKSGCKISRMCYRTHGCSW